MQLPKAVQTDNNPATELPPFVKTWNRFYLLILAWLVLLIGLFWLITLHFQ